MSAKLTLLQQIVVRDARAALDAFNGALQAIAEQGIDAVVYESTAPAGRPVTLALALSLPIPDPDADVFQASPAGSSDETGVGEADGG